MIYGMVSFDKIITLVEIASLHNEPGLCSNPSVARHASGLDLTSGQLAGSLQQSLIIES